MKNQFIYQIELDQIKNIRVPVFHVGDTVNVKVWIVDGSKKRIQTFDGIVISIRKKGISSSFTVRKNFGSEGVEKTFSTYSPAIKEIYVKRSGIVRKSKLYFLRNVSKKLIKIKEKINFNKNSNKNTTR
ncbi:50S ribosomal protein L19 [Candidatus Riesia sp. GBBU]|nr:50S ribosomal protein L19 [Candidatus Riesia sp. GBBU]